ncbi:hypothetical protein JXB01_04565 [Candidatus Micrarchaeota archaeon]|nr:hypothetical protein [Candidatus Micrarchaeota archaeon]
MKLEWYHLPALIFIILVLAIFYVIFMGVFSSNLQIETGTELVFGNECGKGEMQKCFLNECEGVKYCNYGYWGECTLKKVCTPGEKVYCADVCPTAYKTCNECGTGYGPCIPKQD